MQTVIAMTPRVVLFRVRRLILHLGTALAVLGFITACGPSPRVRAQGYVEGEFVYVSSQLAGPLQTLNVYRGTEVKAGQPLFELDRTMEKAALDQAQASLTFTEKDFERQEFLSQTPGTASVRDLQLARSARDQDRQRLAQAEWNYTQKAQAAPQSGIVFDTLYRQGEWVEAGHPVVQLLPPENIEVRAFLPESAIGTLHAGDPAKVFVDGVATPYLGTLRFIFPKSEYTPPVIYSEESREKLVYMVEIDFDPATAVKLHPGQPVDVEFDR
jgi:HlyD family secretion protein